MDNQAAEEYMLKQAKSEGKAEGKAERDVEIAKNLLSQNIDINTISTATGLPVEKINALKS
jgi:predicted transposase/invertase (TIGR01784 family)